MVPELQRRFESLLEKEEISRDYDFGPLIRVDINTLIDMCSLAGVVLDPRIIIHWGTDFVFVESGIRIAFPKDFFLTFYHSDVQSFKPRVTHLPSVDQANGMILFRQVERDPANERISVLAEENLHRSLTNMATLDTSLKLIRLAVFRIRRKQNIVYWKTALQRWVYFILQRDNLPRLVKTKALVVRFFFLASVFA